MSDKALTNPVGAIAAALAQETQAVVDGLLLSLARASQPLRNACSSSAMAVSGGEDTRQPPNAGESDTIGDSLREFLGKNHLGRGG